MISVRKFLVGGSILIAILFSPVTTTLAEDSEDAEPVQLLTEAVPEISGPRRMVAVGKFDAIGAFRQAYGDWDIGGGVAAMLTSALVESNRFIVVERANVQQILSEQQMKGQGVSAAGTGPELGKVIGVNIMIYGSVTEFGADDEGSGISFGVSGGGGLRSLFGGALSSGSTSGKITIDVRLVDTTTSQVIETYRVSEEIEGKGFDVSVGYKNVNMGTNNFVKTPLGEATRRIVEKIVRKIALATANIPWTGRVVEVEGTEIYINAGTSSGLDIGDTFKIERIIKKLTDPETGAVLQVRKKALGAVTITGVGKKISWGDYSPVGLDAPLRGDLVSELN